MINNNLNETLTKNRILIDNWLSSIEDKKTLPLYTSVDIRDAGFKSAIVDTNLFPAGFNNLCKMGLEEAKVTFKEAIVNRNPNCKSILIVTENHTRNTWYLENVYVLKTLIEDAGFKATLCTNISTDADTINLSTASGKNITLVNLKSILNNKSAGFDLIILNNDLADGVPYELTQFDIPIYPSISAGWHSRLKSHHFSEMNQLIQKFANLINCDPWIFSCLYEHVDNCSINQEEGRERLYQAATKLFARIQSKYNEYNISEKPFIFIKANSGTYGMGVTSIESADEILQFNRKNRNKLYKGKSALPISSFILQEGVPTISNVDNNVSEVCIYKVVNQFVGGFYRVNNQKTSRENLNSRGMTFTKMCAAPNMNCVLQENTHDECGVKPDQNLSLYRILARIAGVASQKEIVQLEAKIDPSEVVRVRR
ncbi:glutamate--cysteine ligase [Candidatus Marinamargulisbacteria bacterium SCGC AG-410-N11]|nr:glutamate--cysteine ligase [Candidatus Marinamargulisbacteria bacterium SCGC AG-410-N11]